MESVQARILGERQSHASGESRQTQSGHGRSQAQLSRRKRTSTRPQARRQRDREAYSPFWMANDRRNYFADSRYVDSTTCRTCHRSNYRNAHYICDKEKEVTEF